MFPTSKLILRLRPHSSISNNLQAYTKTAIRCKVSKSASGGGGGGRSNLPSNLHKKATQALGRNAAIKEKMEMTAKAASAPTPAAPTPTPKPTPTPTVNTILEDMQQVQQQQQQQPPPVQQVEQQQQPPAVNMGFGQPQQQQQQQQMTGGLQGFGQAQQQASTIDTDALASASEVGGGFDRHEFHQGHLHQFAPKIVVVGVGGGGSNAVNNMIANQLNGVDFLALNTDAQHLSTTLTENRLQIGTNLTSGLGCGANPDAGRLAAEESREQITDLLNDAHMVFITAGMGGGTGTGAAPVVAEICYNLGILTVGVVTKPFRFEGTHRMRLANEGIGRMQDVVDTLIMIPNQNLFHLATDNTSFMDSFAMADNVLLAGVKSITDLMTTPGLINLDFADVQSVMHGMGNAMLGTGVASKKDLEEGEERAIKAAEQALANPLLGENLDIATARGMLVNITGGSDMTLFEVDRAAQCITERILDENANIIFGSAYDQSLEGSIRVSVVATGIDESGPNNSGN